MQVRAKLNYLRISPRKVRLVSRLIKNKDVKKAKTILEFVPKKSAKALLKVLNSGIANAKNNYNLNEDNLIISKVIVNEGPKYKRFMPRAFGRTYQIQKKTSHVEIVLKSQNSKIKNRNDKSKIEK